MSESADLLHTRRIKTEKIYTDKQGAPFKQSHEDKTEVAVIKPFNPYSEIKIRENFFQNVVQRVEKKLSPHDKFIQHSREHGRSMTDTVSSTKAIWGGEQPGEIYGARSVKGGRMDSGKAILLERDAYQGIHGFGLMDDLCLPRVKKASLFMLKNGLPTERPREVYKIKEVWVLTDLEPGEEKRDEFGFAKTHSSEEKLKKVSIEKWEEGELQRLKNSPELSGHFADSAKEYLDKSNFIVLKRDVQTDERISDIALAARADKLKEVLTPVIRWVNVATRSRDSGIIPGTPKPKEFDVSKNEDIVRYLIDWIPSQMGVYLGRFHKHGLRHGFLHDQNWSAVATVYDLDSVSGKGVFAGDGEPTLGEQNRDLYDTVHGYVHVIVMYLSRTKEFEDLNKEELAEKAAVLLLGNYMRERFDDVEKVDIPNMIDDFRRFEKNSSLPSDMKYIDILEQALGKI